MLRNLTALRLVLGLLVGEGAPTAPVSPSRPVQITVELSISDLHQAERWYRALVGRDLTVPLSEGVAVQLRVVAQTAATSPP